MKDKQYTKEEIEKELEESENLWGKFSSDCLGFEITYFRKELNRLTEEEKNKLTKD